MSRPYNSFLGFEGSSLALEPDRYLILSFILVGGGIVGVDPPSAGPIFVLLEALCIGVDPPIWLLPLLILILSTF